MKITIHPGEILKEEFMTPYKLSSNALAKELNVPANRISSIVSGRRDITADTAKRLSIYFGTSAQFWLNLQSHYDLTVTEIKAADAYKGIQPRAKAPMAAMA